tara:strand:+ start:1912 stop:2871 length:960 start_codon:yes stop_codon:yes gene_type:complete
MASSDISYVTERDIIDVYPSVVDFDTKKKITGWVSTGTTHFYKAYNTGLITVLFFDGIEGTAVGDDPNADYEFRYSAGNDSVEAYISTGNPIDMLMEAGDDHSTLISRISKKASRIIEGRIAYRVQDEIHKDREGNYPAIIVHATALQTIIMLLKANDPNMEDIAPLKEELDEIIEGIISGTIKLGLVNSDSSKGIIRQVSVNASSDLFPVQLRGHYTGSGYELLKVKIESGEAGVIGTAKMTVTGKSTTTLKSDVLVDSDTITGDFQTLGVGTLYIRWSGDDVTTATTNNNDEYEIELWGSALESSVTSSGSIKMTRI